MDPPEIRREGPDYIASWPGAMFRFSRLHDSREDLVALLNISLDGFPGRPDGELYEGKIVLTGSRSKSDAVKACKDRVGETDWYPLLEKACRTVRLAFEEGAPPTLLQPRKPSESPGYMMTPLIREKDHTMWYARGGSGKSLLALATCVAVTTGVEHLGLPTLTSGGAALYLDFEDENDIHEERLELICSGHQHEPARVIHKAADAPLTSIADSVARLASKEDIRFLVVDSAALACGGDPEKADTATAYYRALRTTGIPTTLTLAHHAKKDDEWPFGSIFWWNTMRSLWFLKAGEREDESIIDLGIIHRKVNRGKLQRTFGLRVQFDEESVRIGYHDPGRIYEMRKHLTHRDALIACLRDAPGARLSRLAAQEASKLNAAQIRNVLSRHKDLFGTEPGREEGDVWLVPSWARDG